MNVDERARFEELGTQFTEMATAMAGGTQQGEFVRDAVMRDLESFFGKESVYNKQLAEGLELDKKGQAEIEANQSEEMTFWQELLGKWDVVGNFLTSGLGGVITAALQAAVGYYILANLGAVVLAIGAVMTGIVAAIPLIIVGIVGGIAFALTRAFAAEMSGFFDGLFGSFPKWKGFGSDNIDAIEQAERIASAEGDPEYEKRMFEEMKAARIANERAKDLAEIAAEFRKGDISNEQMRLRIIDANSRMQSAALATN